MTSLYNHVTHYRIPHVSSERDTYFNGAIKLVGSPDSPITFGNYCAIGSNLKIITLGHDYNYPAVLGTFYRKHFNYQHPGEFKSPPTRERTHGPVTIGNDVWIGDDVTILSGVTIGDGCCIGTKSVVTRDLAPYTICGGIPCRKLKNRYSQDKIDYLLQLKWWEWSDVQISENYNFFHCNLNELDLEQIRKIVVLPY